MRRGVCVRWKCASAESCDKPSKAMQSPSIDSSSSLGGNAAGDDGHSTVNFGSMQVTDGPGVVYLSSQGASTDATSQPSGVRIKSTNARDIRSIPRARSQELSATQAIRESCDMMDVGNCFSGASLSVGPTPKISSSRAWIDQESAAWLWESIRVCGEVMFCSMWV
jgi:hypothetical protein